LPKPTAAPEGPGYNPKRGAKVIEYARYVLDRTAPLKKGSHIDSTGYACRGRRAGGQRSKDGAAPPLANPQAVCGLPGRCQRALSRCCWCTTACTWTCTSTANTPIGATDAAGVCDLVVEAALSTILDLEDSVAAVDAEDKVLAYSNWLGILQGHADRRRRARAAAPSRAALNPDRVYTAPEGNGEVTLHGRSLLFVRNVGHLMTNPAILYTGADGQTHEIPEGIMDAMVTTTIALHDLQAPRRATAFATRARARSTSSNPRCTALPRWRSPPSCSAVSNRSWACPTAP
jgi:malate synthase